MKKRAFSFLLAMFILVGCLMVGCSEKGNTPTSGTAATDANETQGTATMGSTPLRDVAEDGVLNLMMVGNSFCYYYVEELYELMVENPMPGIQEVNIYNLYYSGCKLTQHLNWWTQGVANYDLYKVTARGREKLGEKWKLDDALMMADWDYISLQGTVTGGSYLNDDTGELSMKTAELGVLLLDHFHEMFPQARLLWHQTWFSEVGRVSDGYTYTEEDGPKYDAAMAEVCRYMCEEAVKDKPYDLVRVTSGPAWTKARELNKEADVLPYGGLCARLGKNSFGDGRENSGDGYHDGDIGGAQLLNAYVWYMTITGNDIADSKYVPAYNYNGITYELSQAHIAMLKEAAMSVFAEE